MRRPEQAIQRAVFQHLTMRGVPGVFSWHTPNGGFRSPIEAKILKSLGVRPGVPDVVSIKDGRTHAVELKAKGGRLSEPQTQAIRDMREAGALVEVATGLDEALTILEFWGLLRRAA